MRTILTGTLLMLAACNTPHFKEPVFRYAWSDQFGCFRQEYSLNDFDLLTEMEKVDDEMCDDLVGFNAKDWAEEITPTGRELQQWIKDTCSR